MSKKISPDEVKECIHAFLLSDIQVWDWDDFISVPIKDNYLDAVRLICLYLPEKFPPPSGTNLYCSEEGYKLLELINNNFL